MEFKGTKGVWFVGVREGRGGSYLSIESTNSRVCNINSKRIELYNEELANATLIAHAPEMLSFLKHLYNDVEMFREIESHGYGNELTDLIKRATEI